MKGVKEICRGLFHITLAYACRKKKATKIWSKETCLWIENWIRDLSNRYRKW